MDATALIITADVRLRQTVAHALRSQPITLLTAAPSLNLRSALGALQTQHPDLLVLDLSNGHAVAQPLLNASTDQGALLIAIIANREQAFDLVPYRPAAVLLGPPTATLVKEATGKALRLLRRGSKPEGIHVAPGTPLSDRQLALPLADGLLVHHLDDILYCRSHNNITTVHPRNGGRVVIARPLSDFHSVLAAKGFVRIHQSYLVNLKHIHRYVRGEGGEVVLSNDQHLPVSRRQKRALLEAWDRL